VLRGQRVRFGEVSFVLATVVGAEEVNSKAPTANTGSRPMTEIAKPSLTPGRARVSDLLVLGMSEKEIAQRLELSTSTIHHHVGAIYRAMGDDPRGVLGASASPASK
jgi:DNA-binding NarL/FixJ family response regulator